MPPGKLAPPYTTTLGRFSRAIAMRQPGMFLSQPPIATSPSKPSHPATVSIESAITSRETSEYFIPSVPIEIPSETVIVLKMIDFPPASSMPLAASLANWSICTLHGVTMLHVVATPTIDFWKASFLNQKADKILRLGALSVPSNIDLEYFRVMYEDFT